MKKTRILSLLLTLALLAGFTPLTALPARADDADLLLWIKGTEVTPASSVTSGQGWSFDLATRTLTLTNFKYSGEGYGFWGGL